VEWINYHHLLYFWTVAKEGSITQASKELRLAQPTISGQIRALEESLDEKLFVRSGRNLVLTEVGRVVYGYADDIFSLGRELQDTLRGRPTGRPARLTVGIADVMPKLICYQLLSPALEQDPQVHLVCREDRTDRLLADLAVAGLDLVLADEPIGGAAKVRAYNHLLGECSVSIFGRSDLAERYRPSFPGSLEGAPMLLPVGGTSVRRSLDHFFERRDLRPVIVSEFQDSALMKVFGEHGAGLFPAPSAVEKEVCKQHGVDVVGRLDDVREQFFAITVERKIKHPAIAAVTETARNALFRKERKS
jgi:LysR family transcriptional activator of nhaA